MSRVYICGPMTGYADHNRPAFALAEHDLRQAGYEPVNPHENGLLESDDWGMHMRADIRLLLTCDEVALLPGWQDSKGARVEHALATGLGMHVEELDWYIEDPDALRSSAQVWTGDLVSLDIGDESMGLSARNALVDDVIWDAAGAGMTGLRLSIDGEPLAIVYVPEDAPIIRVEMRGDNGRRGDER